MKTKKPFTRERAVLLIAGIATLLSVFLTLFFHPNFFWFTILIGVNLVNYAFTGFCPANIALKYFGVRSEFELQAEKMKSEK